MTQIFINNFYFEFLNSFLFYLDYLILFLTVAVIASSYINLSSSARKTLIDIGTKVGTAVITGAVAGATKSVVDDLLKDKKDENTYKKDENTDKAKDKSGISDN